MRHGARKFFVLMLKPAGAGRRISTAISPGFFSALPSALIAATLLFSPQPALAQFFSQQGPKLVGTNVVGATAEQGFSVAVSADGNTAIVGAFQDNSSVGAAWVYTRTGGVWSQQGKLVANDAIGSAAQGISVGLSADGNTAIVGGPGDNSGAGAAWIYVRSGGTWTQQGAKLVGTGAAGNARQGAVALSADGNTAIVGGANEAPGAAWIYIRNGSMWTQQGDKLVGTNVVGATAQQGAAVALSGDGNTALVGGRADNSNVGAAWVYTRTGGGWSQQGKLVANDAIAPAFQGYSVSLSADGNTAAVGGPFDNTDVGAGWIYVRSAGMWTQQGKLIGGGAVGQSLQGNSMSLSAAGNMVFMGGPNDNSSIGAAWIFTSNGGVWSQQGGKLVGSGAMGAAGQGVSVALSADGKTGIVGGLFDNSSVGAAWVYAQPSLVVSPTTDISASGTQGEGFSPASFQYQSGFHQRQPQLYDLRHSACALAQRILPLRHGHHIPGHCDLLFD